LLVGHNTDDYKFDFFIEKLQDIVIEEEFENMQEQFFSKYCNEFEDRDEIKLIYTEIFKKYNNISVCFIEEVTSIIKFPCYYRI
jgi:ADP-ribosylation factor 2-binding protein